MDRKSLVFIAMGFELVVAVLACFYLGQWVDVKYQLNGLGAALGAFLGLLGWVIHLLGVARLLAKQEESGKSETQ